MDRKRHHSFPLKMLRILLGTSFSTDFIVKLNYCIALVGCSAMSIIASRTPPCKCLQRRVKWKTGDAWKWEMWQAALLSSWIWIHWGQEVLIPEVQFWDDNRKCHMSPTAGRIVPAIPAPRNGEWDMETQHSFAKQTNHPTAHLLRGQNLGYYQTLKLMQPWLPYVYVLMGKNTDPGCTSTENLWSQQWRSQECSPPSPQSQAAVQESTDVLSARDEELQNCYLQKALLLEYPMQRNCCWGKIRRITGQPKKLQKYLLPKVRSTRLARNKESNENVRKKFQEMAGRVFVKII